MGLLSYGLRATGDGSGRATDLGLEQNEALNDSLLEERRRKCKSSESPGAKANSVVSENSIRTEVAETERVRTDPKRNFRNFDPDSDENHRHESAPIHCPLPGRQAAPEPRAELLMPRATSDRPDS